MAHELVLNRLTQKLCEVIPLVHSQQLATSYRPISHVNNSLLLTHSYNRN